MFRKRRQQDVSGVAQEHRKKQSITFSKGGIKMPTFPIKESEVVALVEAMIAGYTAHPADFPSIDPLTDLVALQAALDGYQTDKQGQIDARAQAQLATVTKGTKLDDLEELMKNDLKLSEVDVADDPAKLAQIGLTSL